MSNGTLTSLGGKSKTTYLESEAGKLTVELTVGATAVKKGQPVKLNATEGIIPWVNTDGRFLLLGYAQKDAAVGEVVTVFLRGFACIWALSTGVQASGPVKYASYDSSTDITGPGGSGGIGYSVYDVAATDAVCNGWSLDTSTAANELIRVILMD